MPKDEWGVKRLCPSCSSRFYDLGRDPMTCPNCGAEFDLDSLLNKKSAPRVEKKDTAPTTVATATGDDDDAVVLDDDTDDEDDGVDINDELLEDDGDDNVDLEEIADVPAEDDDN